MTGSDQSGPPGVLPYAKQTRGAVRRNAMRLVAPAIAGILLIFGLIAFGLGKNDAVATCANCGAIRMAESLYCLGATWDYKVAISEGAISRAVQERCGERCPHKWEFAYGTWGGTLSKSSGLGSGCGRLDKIWQLEPMSRRLNEDSAFADSLIRAVRDPRHAEAEKFWEALWIETWELSASKDRESSEPGE